GGFKSRFGCRRYAMTAATTHRLDGLEPDNFLAFLALLGLLRAIEMHDRRRSAPDQLRPRAAWDLNAPPVRPVLHTALAASNKEVAEAAADGLEVLAANHQVAGRA